MTSSFPISDGEQSSLRSVLYHAKQATAENFKFHGILLFIGLVIYCAIVWASESLLFAICGATIIIAGRTFSVERLLSERLTLVADLLVEMDKRGHDRASDIENSVDRLSSRGL